MYVLVPYLANDSPLELNLQLCGYYAAARPGTFSFVISRCDFAASDDRSIRWRCDRSATYTELKSTCESRDTSQHLVAVTTGIQSQLVR